VDLKALRRHASPRRSTRLDDKDCGGHHLRDVYMSMESLPLAKLKLVCCCG
jgi:hypothetical protein